MAADTCLDAGSGGLELEAPSAARPAPDSGIRRPRGLAPEWPPRVPGPEAGGLAWREVSGRVEGAVARPRGGPGGRPRALCLVRPSGQRPQPGCCSERGAARPEDPELGRAGRVPGRAPPPAPPGPAG